MSQGISRQQEGKPDRQSEQLRGDREEPERHEKTEQQRFRCVEGETGIGGGRNGLVVGPVKPHKKQTVMHQPMGPIEVSFVG